MIESISNIPTIFQIFHQLILRLKQVKGKIMEIINIIMSITLLFVFIVSAFRAKANLSLKTSKSLLLKLQVAL